MPSLSKMYKSSSFLSDKDRADIEQYLSDDEDGSEDEETEGEKKKGVPEKIKKKLLDAETWKKDYDLVKIDWNKEEEPLCLVKVRCPSTGAFYTLRVPPKTKTVKEAVAWTFGISEEKYILEQEA